MPFIAEIHIFKPAPPEAASVTMRRIWIDQPVLLGVVNNRPLQNGFFVMDQACGYFYGRLAAIPANALAFGVREVVQES